MKRLAQSVTLAMAPLLGLAWAALPVQGATTLAAVEAALPKLESYVDRLIAAQEVPGLAIAIVFEDDVVYLNGFGVRVEGGADLVDADTVFQVASLSKAISSTVVAALVSQNLVSWDSRITDIDPTFQLAEPYATANVTIADLFAHHSGLPGNAGNELEALGYSRDEILKKLRLVEPKSSFRGGYSYSNFGLTAGAVAAAKAAGLGWEDAADKMLFGPLGLKATSMRHADFVSHENRAELHARLDGVWQPLSQRNPDAQAPAGGVSSNVRDLAQWIRLGLGNGSPDGKPLIGEDGKALEEALAQSHTPVTARGNHPISGLPFFYALGWNISYGPHGVVWGHAGAFSKGARSVVNIYPEENLGIVVLANAYPTGMPEAVVDTFFGLVFKGEATDHALTAWNDLYQSMAGPADAAAKAAHGTPPALRSPSLPASAYAGTYANAYLGEAIVAEEDGALVLKLGPDAQRAFALDHFDRDLFIYYPYDETPDVPYAAAFRMGPDGKAVSMTLDDLDNLGWGTLPKSP